MLHSIRSNSERRHLQDFFGLVIAQSLARFLIGYNGWRLGRLGAMPMPGSTWVPWMPRSCSILPHRFRSLAELILYFDGLQPQMLWAWWSATQAHVSLTFCTPMQLKLHGLHPKCVGLCPKCLELDGLQLAIQNHLSFRSCLAHTKQFELTWVNGLHPACFGRTAPQTPWAWWSATKNLSSSQKWYLRTDVPCIVGGDPLVFNGFGSQRIILDRKLKSRFPKRKKGSKGYKYGLFEIHGHVPL